jgi:hypothetical protein
MAANIENVAEFSFLNLERAGENCFNAFVYFRYFAYVYANFSIGARRWGALSFRRVEDSFS